MATKNQFKLYNGVEIPTPGFGTWQIKSGDATYNAVSSALKTGYRHIDTANAYGNEESVGKAVRDSGIDRAEIFITSKLPGEVKTYEGALQSFEDSYEKLGLDYFDLYLIHAPWPWHQAYEDFSKENVEVWKAMVKIYKTGKVKAIGVSNFEVTDLKVILDNTDTKPMVNQIKFHIGHTQEEVTQFCQKNDILVEAFSPLATGELLNNETLTELAAKYGKKTAQISLAYILQRGVLPLPKSTTPERIKQNLETDFELSLEDISILNHLEVKIENTHGPIKK